VYFLSFMLALICDWEMTLGRRMLRKPVWKVNLKQERYVKEVHIELLSHNTTKA